MCSFTPVTKEIQIPTSKIIFLPAAGPQERGFFLPPRLPLPTCGPSLVLLVGYDFLNAIFRSSYRKNHEPHSLFSDQLSPLPYFSHLSLLTAPSPQTDSSCTPSRVRPFISMISLHRGVRPSCFGSFSFWISGDSRFSCPPPSHLVFSGYLNFADFPPPCQKRDLVTTRRSVCPDPLTPHVALSDNPP